MEINTSLPWAQWNAGHDTVFGLFVDFIKSVCMTLISFAKFSDDTCLFIMISILFHADCLYNL